MRPVDSDDTLVRKWFQRFGKDEISRAFSLVEPHESEVCPTPALLDRHYAVVLYPRLEVTVGSRLLPKRVDLWCTTFFDHPRKTCRLNFEELHSRMARPALRSRPTTKSARELRQGGSDYRCCIPALAGFVSPQSIVPDGMRISPQDWHRATLDCVRGKGRDIDKPWRFCLHRRREMVRLVFAGFSPGYCEFLHNTR